jgi:hypothetical protein
LGRVFNFKFSIAEKLGKDKRFSFFMFKVVIGANTLAKAVFTLAKLSAKAFTIEQCVLDTNARKQSATDF